jgi:cytosine deaminase
MDDLLLRDVTLPDGRSGVDVLVRRGRFEAIGERLAAPAGIETIAGAATCCSPPFVDAHFHMDATLSYGLPRVNAAARCSKASRCGAS